MSELNPSAYRRWYETPLGARVDADEKDVVFALADLRWGERVLDIGCGDGNYTGSAAERTGTAIGLDSSAAMSSAATARVANVAGIRWVEGNATSLPFPDETFDVALIMTVPCFARDPHTIMGEAFRILRPGGRLILGELGRYSLWAMVRRMRGVLGSPTWKHAHFFSPHELRALLRNAGFAVDKSRSAVFYPPIKSLCLLHVTKHIERLGRWLCPELGALLIMRGTRPA